MNRAKLAIPSHSEPLQWEKIGKVVNRAKLAVPSHSEPLWLEKIGKVANQAKLAISSHLEPKCQVDLRSNFFHPYNRHLQFVALYALRCKVYG